MVKYTDTMIVFSEIPEHISLAINISNCQNRCPNCHSKELWGDIGEFLTEEKIMSLIEENDGINAICFMGEGKDWNDIIDLANFVRKKYPNLKIGIYSGRDEVEDIFFNTFDFVKVGRYDEKYGPLNKNTTNQRMYEIIDGKRNDVTYKFWRKI